MENEIYLMVEGLEADRKAAQKITGRIQKMPGIEVVSVDPTRGSVSVTGGDLDQLMIEDTIESMGYQLLR